MARTSTICVIDDNPVNVDLLEQELTDAGHRVVTAEDGELGLEVIERELPDLVLLDVMMPGMSGYEVCRRLRGGSKTATLPIILVTAKSGAKDEVIGLDAGANDFVTKPINIERLLARIRTQLRIKSLQDELRRNYEAFVRLDQSRRQMTSMITHDLKSPLMTIVASAKLLLDERTQGDTGHVAKISSLMLKSTQKMQELIEDFLSISVWEHTGLEPEIEACDLREIIEEVLEIFQHLLRDRKIDLSLKFHREQIPVFVDPILIGRVLQNLLSNAIKYNSTGGKIEIATEASEDGHITTRIADDGQGIPEEVLPRVFNAFFRHGEDKLIEGSGLGLAVVRAILNAHHSEHEITSHEAQGTQFQFNLPQAPSLGAEPPEELAAFRASSE